MSESKEIIQKSTLSSAQLNRPHKKKTPKKVRPSIRADAIHPSDIMTYDFQHSCDHCTHFKSENESCTLGYNAANHRKEANLKLYELSGRMILCRFLEID